jgi:ribonuclease HI
MVYKMRIHADGACRNNGKKGKARGSAAAVWNRRYKDDEVRKLKMPRDSDITPTNQRAELHALILALEIVIDQAGRLRQPPALPRFNVRIFMDSKYAISCVTEWVQKWQRNGWQNSADRPVSNKDLVQRAVHLKKGVERLGSLRLVYIPREENSVADRSCNEILDEMEREARIPIPAPPPIVFLSPVAHFCVAGQSDYDRDSDDDTFWQLELARDGSKEDGFSGAMLHALLELTLK